MISASESVINLLKTKNTLSTSAGAIVEYNLNSMVEHIKATGTEHTTFNKAYKKLFPIDTIYKPFRPLSPGIKYLIYTTNNTDTPANSYQTVKELEVSTKPRLYYPGPDTYYKYWVGPKNTDISISLEYFKDEAKLEPKEIFCNKVIARFETGHDTPSSWTIKGTKLDGSEITLGSGNSLNSNAEAIVYYNGTSWSNTEPESYTTPQSFKKVTLEAINSQSGSFIGVLELSPRWVIDISSDLQSFAITKETGADENVLLPVGTITSNSMSMSLNKYKQGEKLIVEYNRNMDIDIDNLYLFKNTVIRPYINIIDSSVNNKIYQGTFYMHSWTISEFGEAELLSLDSAKFLQETLCPEVLIQDGSITLALRRILDAVGFSTYKINLKKEGDNITDSSIPTLSYWWTSSEETVWEALQALCRDFQINAFIDENNVLNFYTRDKFYESAPEAAWKFTSEPITENSITILPNIISYTSKELASANEVRVRYSVPTIYSGENTASPLWTSDTSLLGAGALSKDLGLSDEFFNLETTTFDTSQTNKLLGDFSGYVLLNNEIIEYDGIEYQYVPIGSNTPVPVIVKSKTDVAKWKNLSKPNTLTEQYFTATGRYKIKSRGALSTEDAKRVHPKSPSSYINTTPGTDPDKFNLYKIDITTAQDKGYKPGDGTFKAPVNPMSKTVSKAFLSLSNLDKDKRTFDIATKQFNSVDNTKSYFAFGTRMFFDSQFESPEQAGGLAIFTDPQGKYGYYLILRSTHFAGLKKDLMLVKQWKVGNKTGIKVLKDSQDNTFSTLAGIYAGSAYNVDVVIKKETGQNTITVFVNGFKMTAKDTLFTSGESDVNPVDPTKNVGVHCGQGVVYFEYIYAKDITKEEYDVLSTKSGLDYIGVYSDDTLSLLYGDLVYAAGETVDSRKGSLIEFGSTAREIRKIKTIYSERPGIPNYVRTGNNKYATVLAQRIQPFSFEAYVLNNTSTTIPLHDGQQSTFYVNGNTIVRSNPIEYDTKNDSDSNNIEPVIFDTNWIQSESDAKSLAEWIKGNILNKGRLVSMEIFGNPLLVPGDLITINYPLQSITESSGKYIITRVYLEYNEGVTTTIECRAI